MAKVRITVKIEGLEELRALVERLEIACENTAKLRPVFGDIHITPAPERPRRLGDAR